MRCPTVARFLLALPAMALAGCAEQDNSNPQAPAVDALDQSVGADIVGEFAIVKTAGDDQGGSSATADGIHYLVGFDNGTPNIAKARLIRTPNTVGTIYSTKREGVAPTIGFDGTNYLMVWTDNRLGSPIPIPIRNVYGQRINTSGAKVGNIIHITNTDDVIIQCGLAFAGGKYVVTFLRFDGRLYRRFVDPAGTVSGPVKVISTGQGVCGGSNGVATDGTNFLAVWLSFDLTSIMARLVRADGTLGAERTLDATPDSSSHGVSVAFNGGNYLVVWSDVITSGSQVDLFGRLVTAAGAANGVRKTIQTSANVKFPGPTIASGSNFAVTFSDDVANPTTATFRVRFFNSAGSPLSASKMVFKTVNGKVALASGIANGSSFFFVVSRSIPGADPLDYSTYTGWDLDGSFKTLVP